MQTIDFVGFDELLDEFKGVIFSLVSLPFSFSSSLLCSEGLQKTYMRSPDSFFNFLDCSFCAYSNLLLSISFSGPFFMPNNLITIE